MRKRIELVNFIEEYSSSINKRNNTNIVEYDFDNIDINGDRIAFDILAKTNLENIKFASADLFIKYSNSVFGDNIVDNEGIVVNRSTIYGK